jgi:Domain of unknown function (DUF4405)
MTRPRAKLLVDLALLPAAVLTFGSGLVLLLRFHAGLGPYRLSALGLSRIAWLDLHRLSALVVAVGIVTHVALNGRAFVARLRGAFTRGHAAGGGMELLTYVATAVMLVTGLVAWGVLDGSAPLGGPIPPGRLHGARHAWVDVHDRVGLVDVALVVHHVGHRWRALGRALGRLAGPGRAPAGREA